MFNKIPTVPRPQELIDKAFSKASKIEEPYYPTMELRVRKEIQDRISVIESVAVFNLDRLVKTFPSSDRLHPFYRSLLDMMFDLDRYKISLSKMDKTSRKITDLSTQKIRQLKVITDVREMNARMREYYGRVASLIGDLSDDLNFLSQCRDYMRKVPQIEDTKTFIIAGMPNVGKSSFLSKVTNASPKVAPYPFTTQSIFIGNLNHMGNRIQLIDTPGILDRPMDKRNKMETNAILALRHIESTVLFFMDLSRDALYTKEEQDDLFNEIRSTINSRITRVQTKIDISEKKEEKYAISTETGEGIEDLLNYIKGIKRVDRAAA